MLFAIANSFCSSPVLLCSLLVYFQERCVQKLKYLCQRVAAYIPDNADEQRAENVKKGVSFLLIKQLKAFIHEGREGGIRAQKTVSQQNIGLRRELGARQHAEQECACYVDDKVSKRESGAGLL